MQDIIKELEGAVESDFNPAWCLFDALSSVVWPPSLDKTQPENTQTSEVINTDALCHIGLNANLGGACVEEACQGG